MPTTIGLQTDWRMNRVFHPPPGARQCACSERAEGAEPASHRSSARIFLPKAPCPPRRVGPSCPDAPADREELTRRRLGSQSLLILCVSARASPRAGAKSGLVSYVAWPPWGSGALPLRIGQPAWAFKRPCAG